MKKTIIILNKIPIKKSFSNLLLILKKLLKIIPRPQVDIETIIIQRQFIKI